jgi:uncharacterized protein YwqG
MKSEHEKDNGIEEHLNYINSLRKPAIAISTSTHNGVFSQIGGLPDLPEDMAWPEYKGSPLPFLCQLDLSEIPSECVRNGLPASGILYIFYNYEYQWERYDPKDKGYWQVIYTPKLREECSCRDVPKELIIKDYIYKAKAVTFIPIETYPDWDDDRIRGLNMTLQQGDQYVKLRRAPFQEKPAHQLLGYPSPMQGNDMELECQLASNGLGGDARWYDPRAEQLADGRSDWILLFQLDSDDDMGMMWGDCGKLYFWIKKTDLKETRFEGCWMILQCG